MQSSGQAGREEERNKTGGEGEKYEGGERWEGKDRLRQKEGKRRGWQRKCQEVKKVKNDGSRERNYKIEKRCDREKKKRYRSEEEESQNPPRTLKGQKLLKNVLADSRKGKRNE